MGKKTAASRIAQIGGTDGDQPLFEQGLFDTPQNGRRSGEADPDVIDSPTDEESSDPQLETLFSAKLPAPVQYGDNGLDALFGDGSDDKSEDPALDALFAAEAAEPSDFEALFSDTPVEVANADRSSEADDIMEGFEELDDEEEEEFDISEPLGEAFEALFDEPPAEASAETTDVPQPEITETTEEPRKRQLSRLGKKMRRATSI